MKRKEFYTVEEPMKEPDWIDILLAVCWQLFKCVWIICAYLGIMYCGYIFYNTLLNNIDYSISECLLSAIVFGFASGMIKGYYEDTDNLDR